MAKRQIRDYVFSPGIAGVGTLKVLAGTSNVTASRRGAVVLRRWR